VISKRSRSACQTSGPNFLVNTSKPAEKHSSNQLSIGRNPQSRNTSFSQLGARMSEKKRKRHGEAAGRPSKKAATGALGNLRIELVDNGDVVGPVLGIVPYISLI
jgi:hypothetical protein